MRISRFPFADNKMSEAIVIRPEQSGDSAVIDSLQRAAFGPGAYARAAFRVREQAAPDLALSFVAERGGSQVGSVRLTPVRIGERRAMLLGPLVVDPCCANQGIGKALVRHALAAARERGQALVLLVGDLSYYGPLGFRQLPPKSVSMPGPADPGRILAAELQPGAAAGLAGIVEGDRTG
jgi:predicted N-acetyltransferase YhbS